MEEEAVVEKEASITPKVFPSGDPEAKMGSVEEGDAESSTTSSGSGVDAGDGEDMLSVNEEVPNVGHEENVPKEGIETSEKSLNKPIVILANSSAKNLSNELRFDQFNIKNFTDLDFICSDGYIPVHRCILMGASKFLRDLLIEKDIRDASTINLPDVSVHHLSLVLSLLYCGKTVFGRADEEAISEIMIMLGLPVQDFQFRLTKGNDIKQAMVVRYVLCSDMSDDIEHEDNSIIGSAKNDDNSQDGSQCQQSNIVESTGTVVGTNEVGVMHDVTIDTASSSKGVSVEQPVAENLRCLKCESLHLSEQELFNHLEGSDSCSNGILRWVCFEDRRCLLCEHIPNNRSLQTLLEHLTLCVDKSPTIHREKEVLRNTDSIPQVDLENKPLDQLTDSAHSVSVDAADKSFEEACSGLLEQMCTQKQHSKTYHRKRNLKDTFEDTDNKSISSSSSHTSSRKSGKRRKTSGSSNNSLQDVPGPLGETLESDTVVNNVDVDVIRKEFSINTQMDIYNLSTENLRTILHKCPICKISYPKMKRTVRCLRQHGYRSCWACLKVFANHGPDFDNHSRTEHSGETEGKVACPLCLKEFDYNIGLPTHIGNYHYRRIMDKQTETVNEVSRINAGKQETAQPENTDNKMVPVSEVRKEEQLGDTITSTIATAATAASSSSPKLQDEEVVALRSPSDDSDLAADSLGNGVLRNSEDSSVNCMTPSPSKINKPLNVLSEMVKSCQICNTIYQFSEAATKCLKTHGYKRCWACIEPFRVDEVSEHIRNEHVIPGSPNMVACFLCLNSYAYNKGLNLHIGRHLAEYDRLVGIKPMKRKKYSKVNTNNQPVDDELITEDDAKRLEEKESTGSKKNVVVQQYSQLKNQLMTSVTKKKRGRKPKNPLPNPVIQSVSEDGSDVVKSTNDGILETGDTEKNETSSKNLEEIGRENSNETKGNFEAENEGELTTENTNEHEVQGEADDENAWKVGNTITAPTSKVFLNFKEMNGVMYKIYGLMDPVNGVQSGKTIAIPDASYHQSCDK